MSTVLSHGQQSVIIGNIPPHRDVFISNNATAPPIVTIGGGAFIGRSSLIIRDVEPWTIDIGIPGKKNGERPSVYENVL